MASKIMVKIPVTPFGQVNKSKAGGVNGELIAIARTQDGNSVPRCTETGPRAAEATRIAQLEQNMRFLQEQHHLMLTSLHGEVESLRNRNRELQFQLVFVKGTVPSSPSSSEDDAKHKVYTSPKTANITPLQVELLEKELHELKLQMQEVDSRNVYLSAIVDEQKKKLERYEREREKERERAVHQPDPELLRKLDDSEAAVRRLRRENSDLRRENAALQARAEGGLASPPRGRGGRQHRGGAHHRPAGWFPPLQAQVFWQGGGPRGGEQRVPSAEQAAPLPGLANSGSAGFQGRRGPNNNHYHEGRNRKYRNGPNSKCEK